MKPSLKTKAGLILTIATLSLTQIAAPQNAHAIAGFATFNPAIGFVGVYLAAGGVATMIGGAVGECISFSYSGQRAARTFTGLGLVATIIGIVLLDKENGTLTYREITYDLQKKLGITDEEAASYNAELDKINLINQTINETLAEDQNAGIEKAAQLWREYKTELEPSAFNTLSKIIKYTVENSQ